MKPLFIRIRKTWFEVRIFISLSIVLIISLLSFLVFKDTLTNVEIAGSWFGFSSQLSIRYGYYFVAFLLLIASAIRMWAGSVLTSKTVMAFKIQNSKLLITGPYSFIRHPIYFADMVAFIAFSLCLKPIGLLMPLLILLHYYQLINYEEEKLRIKFGDTYEKYINSVPGILPGIPQIRKLFKDPLNFYINFDGFRHNAQYILFIPGLIVAAYTDEFIHAILIGLPAVVDWAAIHTMIGVSKDTSLNDEKQSKRKTFARSKVFKDILYAQCWEDPELDRIAFKIKPGDTVFSITSGGCNALAFLIDDPGKVICLDMNQNQNFLLSLKINAFRTLSHDELLEFFGVHSSTRRWKLYEKLKPFLPEEEQEYWYNKKEDINNGILHCGRYEKYMHLLKGIFRILIGKKIIYDLFNSVSKEERKVLYDSKWNNLRWKLFCHLFLSRSFASIFFDKAFYKYLEPSFSFKKYYRSAVKRVVTELPVKENYFLAYILLGNYYNDNFPVYLKKDNYESIRNRVNRIEMVTSGCMDYFKTLPPGTISEFNFTNIFEWMSLEEYALLLKETIRAAKDGAIVTYRNHLVTRSRPESLANQLIPDTKLSAALHERDLSFIYKAYVVEQIKKN